VIQVMRLELSHRRKKNYKNYFPTNQNWKNKIGKKNYVEKDEKMTLANPDQLEKLMKWVMRLGLFHRRQIKKITKLNSQQTKY